MNRKSGGREQEEKMQYYNHLNTLLSSKAINKKKKKLSQPLEINKKEEWGVIELNERNKERGLEEKEMIERG